MENCIKVKNSESSQSGYTLVEMAIALLVLGIIIAGFTQAYSIYLRQQQIEVTDNNLKQITNSLQRFKQLNGRFPCPAPLTAPRADATYGAATTCINTATIGTVPAPGSTGNDGIVATLSSRAGLAAPRVSIGAIPFRALNLDEQVAYDGYGSKYVYAVTESLTERSSFNPLNGGIGIVDASGASMIVPDNSGLFTIFSPGRDRKGGYDKQGNVLVACGTDIDSQNCDFGNNAIFSSALESNAAGNVFDDRIIYFSELSDPMWARDETSPTEDIVDLALGNVGIGTGNSTPAAKLDIKTTGLVGQPEGTLRSSNGVRTSRICPDGNNTSSTANCFEPRNIGGNNTSTDAGTPAGPGDGMRCTTGYMNGIMDGRPICEDVIRIGCPGNSVMTGLTGAGIPVCTYTCPTETRNLCGSDRTLPLTPSGSFVDLTAGSTGSYTERWRCRTVGSSAVWQLQSQNGSCTCTPEVVNYDGNACGDGFTGTYTWTFTRTCPDGTETWTSNHGPSVCACAPRDPYVYTENCPNENYEGSITHTVNWVCPQGDWDWANETVTNTCRCSIPATTTREISGQVCGEGEIPSATPTESFNPATCSWEPDDVTCSCDDQTVFDVYRDPPCEPWEHVNTQSYFTYRNDAPGCQRGSESLVTMGTCAPNLYTWQIFSSPGGNPVSSQVGPMVNSSCTYNNYTSGSSQSCSASSGSQFQVHRCTCRPAY